MTQKELLYRRAYNQLLGNTSGTADWVVKKMLAIQGQEYAVSKYALGLRSRELTNYLVEKSINDGKIIRTHLLRPTWHLVHADDLRWLLAYSKSRVSQLNGFMYRKMQLTNKVFRAANKIIEQKLSGKNHLTRDQVAEELRKKKINGDGVRISAIMTQAELEGLICSGPRAGKQFTYALINERVPISNNFNDTELMEKLTRRYFESRGPAMIDDLCMWSSMKKAEAKRALLAFDDLKQTMHGGKVYYYFNGPCPEPPSAGLNFLMPDYDEFGMSYKDRSLIQNLSALEKYRENGGPLHNRMLLINGKIAGTWQKQAENPVPEIFPFSNLKLTDQKKLKQAVQHYTRFFS